MWSCGSLSSQTHMVGVSYSNQDRRCANLIFVQNNLLKTYTVTIHNVYQRLDGKIYSNILRYDLAWTSQGHERPQGRQNRNATTICFLQGNDYAHTIFLILTATISSGVIFFLGWFLFLHTSTIQRANLGSDHDGRASHGGSLPLVGFTHNGSLKLLKSGGFGMKNSHIPFLPGKLHKDALELGAFAWCRRANQQSGASGREVEEHTTTELQEGKWPASVLLIQA